MKIHLANYEPGRTGGGWTFAKNLVKLFGQTPYEEADIYFIAGASQTDYESVEKARRDGKKVVLRVDNALRNSRNRNTGMTRMRSFATVADLVIYQSEWAKGFLKPYLNVEGPVILNGVDREEFYPKPEWKEQRQNHYIYVRSSRDEGKGWINAWYWWVANGVGKHLNIVGRFSAENLDYNFDFYNDERFTFYGEVKSLAPILQINEKFLYTYLNDACSNTLLEARACGLEIVDVNGMLNTGGAPEIMALSDEELSTERMGKEYDEVLRKI